tara:strand:+ start:1529 stop:2038 length:510 start_codon:yes stop_codon:yes gene_type:complete
MSSLKVSNAINKLIHNEKVSQIDEIKTYIRDSVDDDFNFNVNGEEKNIDDFCDLLDLFSEDIEKKTLNLKSTKKSKSKKPKKKSFYNDWLSERLISFGQEQNELDESDRVPNKDRMKVISKEWKDYKETSDYANTKEKWELKNTKISGKSKVDPVTQNNSDSENSDDDI